jgi:hypothetical protein
MTHQAGGKGPRAFPWPSALGPELRHQRELMRDGFAQVDKRFEAGQQDMRELQRRMDRFMLWSFATTVAVGGVVVSLIRF